MKLTLEQTNQANIEMIVAAAERQRRNPSARLQPADFANPDRVISTFGWANVARYIVMRKGDENYLRYEAFADCFIGCAIADWSTNFEQVTDACIALEATGFFLNPAAYDTAVRDLNLRRETAQAAVRMADTGFQKFISGLSVAAG